MDGYISEIRLFGGTFAPQGFMLCQGQVISIAENNALYALIGTIYGGDGVNSFNLPDLRGRTPMGTGDGPGLQPIDEGQAGGVETITLTNAAMPIHNHAVTVSSVTANVTPKALSTAGGGDNPNQQYFSQFTDGYNTLANASLNMATQQVTGSVSLTLSGAGGSTPFANRSPFLGLNFIICVEGIFPSRN